MMAAPNKKLLVRTAIAIHAQLAAGGTARLPTLPLDNWKRCRTLVRQIRRAQLKGWHLAADDLRLDLGYALTSLTGYLIELKQRLDTAHTDSGTTTARDLYEDLKALEEEFQVVSYSRKDRTFSVHTEPIELDGLELGSFEVRLDVSQLAADSNYRVVALEPNPSSSRPEVTHPHVMDEVLCEGEGRQAIRRALAEGRLVDFFQLVAGVLRSYNDESPFVALDEWHDQRCCDCGQMTNDDYGLSCSTCGDWVCGECEVSCGGCGDGHCTHCLARCSICEDSYCRHCLRSCLGCRQAVCSQCLLRDERCLNCHEENEDSAEDDNPAENNDSAATADTATLAHRVGQAAVPA